ncbi:Uncharacterised protein [Legionella pneumophila]|nr:Uncharacterised protein [Legionella pneumophila]
MTAPEPYCIKTKLATHMGNSLPVIGWIAVIPVSIPRFSIVASSASAILIP